MERRDFLMTACATGAVAAVATGTAMAQQPTTGGRSNRAFLEFREYHCANAEKKQQLIKILDNAMIPALNRLGMTPVGIFETSAELNPGDRNYDKANDLKVFLLCQYNMRQLTTTTAGLLDDETFMADAGDVFTAPMNSPLYETCESTLMYGFPNCPRIEVPTLDADRVIQIRYYKSYNIERNARKIEMFDPDGELALFRKCGMDPIFFGETLAGRMMPNLTYMLGFKNMDAQKEAWAKFVASPEWDALKNNPKYKDTANKIVNIFLKPSPKSQV